jgi:hypothetical protein
MFKQRPNVFLIPNLPDRGIPGNLAWMSETVRADALKKLQEAEAARKAWRAGGVRDSGAQPGAS